MPSDLFLIVPGVRGMAGVPGTRLLDDVARGVAAVHRVGHQPPVEGGEVAAMLYGERQQPGRRPLSGPGRTNLAHT